MLLPLLALLLSAPEPASWPQFRGPRRDGAAVGAVLPAKWPADAPAAVWSAPVGEGYAGPAVVAGRVYAHGREGKEEVCRCLDAATGNELWAHRYPAGDFRPPTGEAEYGPQATPTVDGDRVYFFGLLGMLHCLDAATGTVLWRHDCKAEYWGVSKGQKGDDLWFPPCGAAAGPLVDGNRVIVAVGGKKAGTFTAFDRQTGAIVWQALDERSSYASPVLAAPGGVRQLIGFTGVRMVGLHPDTRAVLWDEPFKAFMEQTIISPVVWNDLVVMGGERRPTFALKLTAAGGTVTKKQAWKNGDLLEYTTTPVVVGDRLVGHDARSDRLVCVNLLDGETVWASPRVGRYFSLLAAGDVVLALNNDGELLAVRASADEYTPLARWRVSEAKGTWAHPALVGGRLYVKDKTTVRCVVLTP